MTKITNAALFLLAAGIFTSVSIVSAYQVLIVIPMVYCLKIAYRDKTLSLPISAKFLLVFAAIAVLSLVVNLDLVPRPSKNFGRVKYFLFGVVGIYVYQCWLPVVSDRAKKIILNTLFLGIAVGGIYTVSRFLLDGLERGKPLTETMRYGYGTAMVLLVLLSATLNHKKLGSWFNWKLAIPVILIGFAGMYVTYTRGALLGFLCGLPFVLYYYKPKLGLTLGSIAILAILALGINYLFGSGNYKSRFLVNKDNTSDVVRRSQWQAAVIATKEKPILGWGLSNFHSQLKRIKHQYDLEGKHYDDAHSHNLFLEVASGTGIVGLFFFLGWLVFWAIEVFKGPLILKALVVPYASAFIISSQFEVTFDANNVSVIFTVYSLSIAWLRNVKQS